MMKWRPGMAMVEVVISTIVVGMMLVAAFSAVGASASTQLNRSRRTSGHMLAHLLLAEIMQLDYEDANNKVFGPESGESTTTREAFDDVDDYHNHSESPPADKSGQAFPEFTGWRWTAVVQYINPQDCLQTVANDQGVKRITVRTFFNNVEAASLVGIRTRGLDISKR